MTYQLAGGGVKRADMYKDLAMTWGKYGGSDQQVWDTAVRAIDGFVQLGDARQAKQMYGFVEREISLTEKQRKSLLDKMAKLEGETPTSALLAARCPISGKVAKKNHAVPYKGARLYFCCPNCPRAFSASKTKFAAKANHQLLVTRQCLQVKCPLAGRKVNRSTEINVAGAKVAFCCSNCKGRALKSKGDSQIALVFGEKAFKKGFQVKKKNKRISSPRKKRRD